MKFFSWLSVLFVLVLVIAAITVPGDKKFTEFIARDKGGDTMSCKPVIGESKEIKILVKILSIHTVSYCEVLSTRGLAGILGKNNPTDSVTVAPAKTGFLRVTGTESYLGVFGRFWKI